MGKGRKKILINSLLNFMASKKLTEEVWEKAKEIRGKDSDVWRKDTYDNKIRFGSYGTEGEYGWEIDHKNPQKIKVVVIN